VQSKVLEQIKDKELVVYTVWIPIIGDESSVLEAMKKMPDKRVNHYWDKENELPAAYKQILNINQVAWDIYFLFPRDAEWKDTPPTPTFWMHQLRLDPEKRFDGEKLAEETKKLLQSEKKKDEEGKCCAQ
jgi:hypothetical protein